VEVFGAAEPAIDAELIWMVSLILRDLGVSDFATEINSVGCRTCREDFRGSLVEYLDSRKGGLCEDCVNRLDRNPLRIFDCKNEGCREIIKDAPVLLSHLCGDCKAHFDSCRDQLARFGVNVVVNTHLVRGLDYYTRTVFEFTSQDLGAQKTFLAGGRYDNLVQEMGGPSVPGIGFAIGMERLSSLIPQVPARSVPLYFLATVGEQAQGFVIPMLKSFISSRLPLTYAIPARSLKSQMKYADSLGADCVLIIGEQEVSRGVVLVRDMKEGSQKELPLDAESLPGLLKA
jgi:histidyl-tRNA synthetase